MDKERQLGKLYQTGEAIFQEGELSDCFFVIQEGQVEAIHTRSDGERRLALFENGDIFGEISLLTPDKRRYFTARPTRETRVMRIDERLFLEKLHLDPSFSFRILRHLAQRLHDLESEDFPALPANAARPSFPKRRRQVYDYSVGYHVLMVEDDVIFGEVVRGWLSRVAVNGGHSLLPPSFHLVRSDTLDQALKQLVEEKFEAILLDLNLPDSQGLDTFHRILAAAPDTPIVVLTSLDDEEQALQAVREGAQDFLIKGRVGGRQLAQAIRFARVRQLHALQSRQRGGAGDEDRAILDRLRNLFSRTGFVPGRRESTSWGFDGGSG